jgi:hypothetical protein
VRAAHHHVSGVKAPVRPWSGRVPYQAHSLTDNSSRARGFCATERAAPSEPNQRRVFQQGRHHEQTVDASALRADEGRGIAAISVGEPRAGIDPTISEWGNPAA